MEYLGAGTWVLMNVIVPLMAPSALLPFAGLNRRYRGQVRKLVFRSLKDGQLLWTVIAMCTSAMYDSARHVQALLIRDRATVAEASIAFAVIGWHGIVLLAAAMAVLMGALDGIESPTRREHGRDSRAADERESTPWLMRISGILAVATCLTYTATHLWADT